jgi:DNA-binding transcriptional LysR family regulator
MELRRLRDFLALAEELHFERAARRVGSEQSPFSRRIKDFERDLGVLLFKRNSQGTVLSPAGEAFLPWARMLVTKKEQAMRALEAAGAVFHEELNIGFCDEVPLNHLARLLALFRSSQSNFDIRLIEQTCETLIQDLQSGVLDVGFTLGAPENPNIEARPLWTHDALAITPAGENSAEVESVDIWELARSRIVLGHRQCGCGARNRVDRLLRSISAKPLTKEAANFNIASMLIRAGDGVGIISSAQADRAAADQLQLRPLVEGTGMFTTFLLRNADANDQHFLVLEQLARKVA